MYELPRFFKSAISIEIVRFYHMVYRDAISDTLSDPCKLKQHAREFFFRCLTDRAKVRAHVIRHLACKLAFFCFRFIFRFSAITRHGQLTKTKTSSIYKTAFMHKEKVRLYPPSLYIHFLFERNTFFWKYT